jgi:hypothetical protein
MTRRARALLLAAAVLTVVCAVAAASIMAASDPLQVQVRPTKLIFGSIFRMKGVLADGHPGDQVSILSKPCGYSQKTTVFNIPVRKGGTFSFAAQPMLNTTFSVRAGKTASRDFQVTVQPQLQLVAGQVGTKQFRVDVTTTGGLTLDDATLVIQQHAPKAGGAWTQLLTTKVHDRSIPAAMTSLGSAVFTATGLQPHGVVRAVLPRSGSGACYEPTVSNAIGT